jgi:hypothetical protein
MKLFVIVLVAVFGAAAASCPNQCSGHGSCGLYDLCHCYGNWAGNDCSGRVCPFTKAWVDTALGNENAHNYASCGNKGACDGKSGQCKCYDQFDGKGCRRMVCNNGCSGHGTCEYMEELASRAGCEWDATAQGRKTNCVHASISGTTAGSIKSLSYTGWDAKKIQGCSCDPGWEGNDCSGRICPRGNDPLRHRNSADSAVQVSHKFQVVVQSDANFPTAKVAGRAPSSFVLSFTDTYSEKWYTRPIAVNSNGADAFTTEITAAGVAATLTTTVTNALLDLPNGAITGLLIDPITGVSTASSALTVTVSAAQFAATIQIQLNSPHNAGDLKNRLHCHIGGCTDKGATNSANPGGCSPQYSGVTHGTPACVVTDAVSGTKNEDTCSGRGACDGGSGLCDCYEGYTDEDCSLQTILV